MLNKEVQLSFPLDQVFFLKWFKSVAMETWGTFYKGACGLGPPDIKCSRPLFIGNFPLKKMKLAKKILSI